MDRHSPRAIRVAADEVSSYLKTTGKVNDLTFAAVGTKCRILTGKNALGDLRAEQRRILRSDLYLASEGLGKLIKQHKIEDSQELKTAADLKKHLDKVTKFIPVWVKVAVALALGLGP